MQFPTIDPSKPRYAWDRYKAFHKTICDHHGVEIVQFDTGEALVRVQNTRPDPDGRKQYVDLGVQIIATRDNDTDLCFMLEDGTIVPKTWLHGCTQTVLVDSDTQRVVGIGGQHTIPYHSDYHLHDQQHREVAVAQGIPARFTNLQGGVAWYAGAGRIPVSNRPIRLDRPMTHTPEIWQQARAYRAAAVAWAALEGTAARPSWGAPAVRPVLEVVKYPTFGDMPPIERTNLARGGLTAGVTIITVPYLLIAQPTTMPRTTSAAV